MRLATRVLFGVLVVATFARVLRGAARQERSEDRADRPLLVDHLPQRRRPCRRPADRHQAEDRRPAHPRGDRQRRRPCSHPAARPGRQGVQRGAHALGRHGRRRQARARWPLQAARRSARRRPRGGSDAGDRQGHQAAQPAGRVHRAGPRSAPRAAPAAGRQAGGRALPACRRRAARNRLPDRSGRAQGAVGRAQQGLDLLVMGRHRRRKARRSGHLRDRAPVA